MSCWLFQETTSHEVLWKCCKWCTSIPYTPEGSLCTLECMATVTLSFSTLPCVQDKNFIPLLLNLHVLIDFCKS